VNSLLSINNYFYQRGGAETVFLEQNKLFQKNGWNVIPFAMRHEHNFQSEWERFFVDEIELGKSYGAYETLRRIPKIIYSREARRKIDALITAVEPDIAHAHNVYHHISPAIFSVLKQRGIPVVLTLHDLKIACPAYKMLTHDGVCERCKNGQLWQLARHRCIKDSLPLSMFIMMESAVHRLLGCYRDHVDRFIVPSQFYLDKFVEWGWPRDKFRYIPNFVDTAVDAADTPPGAAFLYVGRLAPEKGVGTFVRAVAEAGVTGWIVGTGPEDAMLRALAQELGASIQFFGHRSGEELNNLVRAARAVVVPSEWYENAPLSVLEAYALQKPVIGARIGGIPELVQEGRTGALFDSASVPALAGQLRRYATMNDAALLHQGRNGRDWVRVAFSPERYRNDVLALYRELGVDTKAAGARPREPATV
jgi:glycosyltransferase involved in cell wall biosynthesis